MHGNPDFEKRRRSSKSLGVDVISCQQTEQRSFFGPCPFVFMMAAVLDFAQALSDSPRFRADLSAQEVNLDELENRLEKVLKSSTHVAESSKVTLAHQAQFVSSLWELSSHFSGDRQSNTLSHLNRMIHTLQEVIRLQTSVVEETQKAIHMGLNTFLKENVKQMKDTKGYFNKISSDLDSALQKNASASKSRPSDVEDASHFLTATQSCFRYTTLDYVYQICMLQSRKKHETLSPLMSLLKSYQQHFVNGAELFRQLEPFLIELGEEMSQMQEQSSDLEKEMEKRHSKMTIVSTETTGEVDSAIEGYLFKRGQSAFRTWNRRWFYLQVRKSIHYRALLLFFQLNPVGDLTVAYKHDRITNFNGILLNYLLLKLPFLGIFLQLNYYSFYKNSIIFPNS